MSDVCHYESVSKNTTQLEVCSGVLGYLCVPEDFGLLYFLLSHDYRAAGSPMSEHRDRARPHPRTPAPPTLCPAAARHFQDPSRANSSTRGWSANSHVSRPSLSTACLWHADGQGQRARSVCVKPKSGSTEVQRGSPIPCWQRARPLTWVGSPTLVEGF